MQVVLLIGAAEYPLEEGHARWLEGLIRATSVDAAGQAWDLEASAAPARGRRHRRESRTPSFS